MGNRTIPSLSTNGNIEDVSLSMKKLFDYFLLADYSQTFFYKGNVASLKYILGNYKNEDDLLSLLNSALTTLYERYFEEVEIDIRLTSTDINSGSADIVFGIAVTTNNIKTDLAETIIVKNNTILFNDKYINELYNI